MLGADLLVVDDWDLVAADDRRIVGRMWRSGEVTGPRGERFVEGAGRQVDTTLADLVSGTHPGRARAEDVVLSSVRHGVLDVALAATVLDDAVAQGRGTTLTLWAVRHPTGPVDGPPAARRARTSPSANRTPSAHRASTAPPPNCSAYRRA